MKLLELLLDATAADAGLVRQIDQFVENRRRDLDHFAGLASADEAAFGPALAHCAPPGRRDPGAAEQHSGGRRRWWCRRRSALRGRRWHSARCRFRAQGSRCRRGLRRRPPVAAGDLLALLLDTIVEGQTGVEELRVRGPGCRRQDQGFEIVAQASERRATRHSCAALEGMQGPLEVLGAVLRSVAVAPVGDRLLDLFGQFRGLFEEDGHQLGVRGLVQGPT